jgi:hypothetical protein
MSTPVPPSFLPWTPAKDIAAAIGRKTTVFVKRGAAIFFHLVGTFLKKIYAILQQRH